MKKALKWIARNPMEIIAAVALSASVLISVINGLTRYFIKYTWNPGTDVNTLCFAYVVFCGSAAAYRRKMHYGIDALVNKFPTKVRKTIELITHVITLVVLALATVLAVSLMKNVGGKIMPNTKISYVWYDLSAVLGFAFMAIYELEHTIELFKNFRKEPEEGEKA